MGRSGRPYKVDERLTELMIFVKEKDWNSLTALFKDFGVNAYDGDKRSALIWASFEGDPGFVKKLIEEGADVDQQDAGGFSALHFAAQEGRVEVAETLLLAGANVNIKDEHGNVPLWTALFSYSDRQMDIIKMLLKHSADADSINNYKRTPRLIMKQRLNLTPEELIKE